MSSRKQQTAEAGSTLALNVASVVSFPLAYEAASCFEPQVTLETAPQHARSANTEGTGCQIQKQQILAACEQAASGACMRKLKACRQHSLMSISIFFSAMFEHSFVLKMVWALTLKQKLVPFTTVVVRCSTAEKGVLAEARAHSQ